MHAVYYRLCMLYTTGYDCAYMLCTTGYDCAYMLYTTGYDCAYTSLGAVGFYHLS